ncbi:alpha/beta fold hydrolase [Nonomuraea typhae]|uniref:alpha/beta fold hydrolase n=1 Tax=Nonomuraea typhae TaxID=2603600 RepID=UPI0012FC039C|nr:alpha/beta hydrolase [Nonomuraea typhae]
MYLDISDGRLYYEVRGTGPLVLLFGAPMDAGAFAPLADLLATDHTVVTADPRGIGRSVLTDPEQESTPALRAADLARLLDHLDAGPAVAFGSSGGAVTVLALAQSRPDLLRAVIAHEPPHYHQLDDREKLTARVEDMIAAYAAGDIKGAWAMFMENANIHLPEGMLDHFVPEPGTQAAADDRYSYLQMLRGTVQWVPDLPNLRDNPAKILIGLGEESAGELCDRTSRALAASLGTQPTMFPGGHIGFAEDPGTFEPRLREVLREV